MKTFINSRLDEMLRVKLRYLDEESNKRRAIANYYLENIKNENINHKIIMFVIKEMNYKNIF